ncbi:MAG TPA: hypothetical protein PKZ32_02300 [Candidatus Melainabacteria bacterium]|nr:hypothetical protein [Candidatus Melainabacteria bacterium]
MSAKVLHGRAVVELFAVAEFASGATAIERFALTEASSRIDLCMHNMRVELAAAAHQSAVFVVSSQIVFLLVVSLPVVAPLMGAHHEQQSEGAPV